ncbi:hypothetical protein [Streptomyces sp. CC224B]|uniref:hypothetical protein n=1 Tax=Streptomyces sp. CC224B TaxID=3044571 RepID=UPI0024A88D58|nr:hypothetical protein [Streptomyces sp. CC224B]
MIRICRECDEETGEPIAVALEHTASCGGRVIYLCPPCRFVLGVVPLAEHPEGSDGRVRFEACP